MKAKQCIKFFLLITALILVISSLSGCHFEFDSSDFDLHALFDNPTGDVLGDILIGILVLLIIIILLPLFLILLVVSLIFSIFFFVLEIIGSIIMLIVAFFGMIFNWNLIFILL